METWFFRLRLKVRLTNLLCMKLAVVKCNGLQTLKVSRPVWQDFQRRAMAGNGLAMTMMNSGKGHLVPRKVHQ